MHATKRAGNRAGTNIYTAVLSTRYTTPQIFRAPARIGPHAPSRETHTGLIRHHKRNAMRATARARPYTVNVKRNTNNVALSYNSYRSVKYLLPGTHTEFELSANPCEVHTPQSRETTPTAGQMSGRKANVFPNRVIGRVVRL